jgi:hypothetical protein
MREATTINTGWHGSKKPKAKGEEPKAKGQEPKAKGQEPKAKSSFQQIKCMAAFQSRESKVRNFLLFLTLLLTFL